MACCEVWCYSQWRISSCLCNIAAVANVFLINFSIRLRKEWAPSLLHTEFVSTIYCLCASQDDLARFDCVGVYNKNNNHWNLLVRFHWNARVPYNSEYHLPQKKLFYEYFKHQLVYLIYSVVLTLMMQVIHIPSRQVYLVEPFGSNRVQTDDALCKWR